MKISNKLRASARCIFLMMILMMCIPVFITFGANHTVSAEAEKTSDIVKETTADHSVYETPVAGISMLIYRSPNNDKIKTGEETQKKVNEVSSMSLTVDDTYEAEYISTITRTGDNDMITEDTVVNEESENVEGSEEKPKEKELTDEEKYGIDDYSRGMLYRIVEAESGGEEIKGRMIVTAIILNRVKSDKFPDTVEKVVFQHRGNRYQFSPIADGRYWEVNIQDSTREAVNRVLLGDDVSQGAMYFMDRETASTSNIEWFDNELTYLFEYGGHEFYK